MPAVSISPQPKLQFFDANGNPLSGGKLYSYDAGTTTPRATYTDSTGNVANANPVILDTRGEASVWMDSGTYKLALYTSSNVLVWTVDGVGGPDVATLAQLAASGGSALVGFLQAGTGAQTRTVQSKLRDTVSVKDFGAVGNGIADDTVAIQNAVNALSANQTLVAEGHFLISTHINLKKSSVVYDFRAAKFTMTGTGGTAYGAGLLIGDSAALSTVPTDVTLLGGQYYPAGNATAYPLADFNPIAILAGKRIQIRDPIIFPKQSVRAISIQTDNTVGSGAPNIDGVSVTGLEVWGDGNAVDGVDITSSGADNLIRNVYVQGFVTGCKRGVNVSTGNNLYNFNGINLNVTVRGASEVGANYSRVANSQVNLQLLDCTKAGATVLQIDDCDLNFLITGTGGGLTQGLSLSEGSGAASQNRLSAHITGSFTTGFLPGIQDMIYPSIEIDGSTLGIDVSGYRSTWNLVTLKNCATNVDDLNLSTDRWGMVISQGAGSGPIIIKRAVESANGTDQLYGLDAVNGSTITIAAGATVFPFGSVAAFSGMLIVNGTAGTGDPALFLMGSAASYLVGGASATYSATSGTASRVNVYYNGSNFITVQNNLAVSVTLRIVAIRMRNAP